MSNIEDFEKIITTMNDAPMSVPSGALQNIYLGCITKYLAQIADALNEIKIKDAIKEQSDGNDD